MKIQYLDPFKESSYNIFQMFQINVQFGNHTLREASISGKEIMVVVGVTGAIRGQIYLGLSKEFALKVVSAMMGGAIVTELDSMAQSAVSELGNMICGNAITVFSKDGLSLDITPPTVIAGNGMQVTARKMSVLSVPVQLDGIDGMEISIALEGES